MHYNLLIKIKVWPLKLEELSKSNYLIKKINKRGGCMKNKFDYFMPVHVCFEADASKRIGRFITGKNVLIISDPFLYQNGTAERIGQSLKEQDVRYFYHIEPNPSCESVDAAAKEARLIKADCIIGLGGGSALDVAKITACLTTNEGSIYDYYAGGERTLKSRETMLICVPTTAGTGSEVTNVAVFTNQKAGVKMPMVSRSFWADVAIVDYKLTFTLPPAVTASTGMDAFCHAIEAYWNRESVDICDMPAMDAMKLIKENIELAYKEPENETARVNIMKASLFAGIAFSQTRTTGIHAISFPLTSEFHASHGAACAVTLPAFIKKSKEEAEEKMQILADYLGCESVDDLSETIEKLMTAINLPTRLHQLGVKASDLEHITEVGLNAAIIRLTPATMNKDTVCELLESIL